MEEVAQDLAQALGVTNSEDRGGLSEQKDGQTHAVIALWREPTAGQVLQGSLVP